MSDKNITNSILIIIVFLLIVNIVILLTPLHNTTIKPKIVSIDSIKDMSCSELHSNFNQCLKKSSGDMWEYCTDIYLPIYYGKC